MEEKLRSRYDNRFDPWCDVVISQGSLEFPVKSANTLQEINLHPLLLEGLCLAGMTSPYEIQKYVFPVLFSDMADNTVVSAPSRTGKTTAALIKALNVAMNPNNPRSQILLLYPTRHQASRVLETAETLAKFYPDMSFHLATRDGGAKLKHGTVIKERLIFGTPEKLREYVQNGNVMKDSIKLIVLDEIDAQSSGTGHQFAAYTMLRNIPESVQKIMLSSACEKHDLERFVRDVMPYTVFVEFPQSVYRPPQGVVQHYLKCSSYGDKMPAVRDLIKVRPPSKAQTIIVCDCKSSVIDVFEDLEDVFKEKKGSNALGCLHSKVKTSSRQETIDDFANGQKKIIVTTPTYLKELKFCFKNEATVVNFNMQISDDSLNHEMYNERSRILEGIPGGLSVNMIEERWAEYVTDKRGKKIILANPEDFENFLLDLRNP